MTYTRLNPKSYLPLAGGTMTGDLQIEKSLPYLRMDDTALDTRCGQVGAPNYTGRWCAYDANGKLCFYTETTLLASGALQRSFVCRRYSADGETEYNNGFYLRIDGSGNPEVIFTTGGGAAWRAGLGVRAFGSLTTLSSSYSLTANAAKVPLTTFSGVGCSASSNGIKVERAGSYMVWATAYMHSGFTEGDVVHLLIYKNGSSVIDALRRAYSANPYEQISAGPLIVTLAANDVVYLYAYNQTGARGTIASRTGMGLFVRQVG